MHQLSVAQFVLHMLLGATMCMCCFCLIYARCCAAVISLQAIESAFHNMLCIQYTDIVLLIDCVCVQLQTSRRTLSVESH
jgi:hypothetical protein